MGSKRILSLDLLRGIAAFSVAIPHFLAYHNIAVRMLETVSVIAVEIFFVLSGYVLGPQILICLRQPKWQNLVVFLARRWMRTIPPYLVALVFTAILFGQLFGHGFWVYAFYVQNLFAFVHSNDYFNIAWSLSVEEWFYLTFPAVLVVSSIFLNKTNASNLYWICALYIGLFTLLRLMHGADPHWGQDVRRVVIFRVDSIAYGFLLFLLHKNRVGTSLFYRTALGVGGLFAATVLLVTAAMSVGNVGAETLFPFLAAAFGMLLITEFVALNEYLDRYPAMRALSAFLGRISYSVYLFHLVLLLTLKSLPLGLRLGEELGLFVGILILFTSAFYYCVERPILAARPHFKRAAEGELLASDLSLGSA